MSIPPVYSDLSIMVQDPCKINSTSKSNFYLNLNLDSIKDTKNNNNYNNNNKVTSNNSNTIDTSSLDNLEYSEMHTLDCMILTTPTTTTTDSNDSKSYSKNYSTNIDTTLDTEEDIIKSNTSTTTNNKSNTTNNNNNYANTTATTAGTTKFHANSNDSINSNQNSIRSNNSKHPWNLIANHNFEVDSNESISNSNNNKAWPKPDKSIKNIQENNRNNPDISTGKYNIKNDPRLRPKKTKRTLLNENNLIKTDSYLHDDQKILLNNKINRRSIILKRQSTSDSTNYNFPFHASKHSQLIPANNNKLDNNIIDNSTGDKNDKFAEGTIQATNKHNNNNNNYQLEKDLNEKMKINDNNNINHNNKHVGLKRSDTATREIQKMRKNLLNRRNIKRKRKSFLLDDDNVLIGNKVSEGHVNFIIAYNMLTGIRVAVSRCSGIMKPLTPLDFKYNKKLVFDYHGNELTPSSQYAFKFKDYCPGVFRELRAIFGLDPADYLVSLTSKYILSELNSPGKSGSFFYYSRDYKFIIKTIHHSEHIHLRQHLMEYYNHIKKYPNTMICQYYGLHRIKMPISFQNKVKHRKIYFLVMNNLFPSNLEIHKTFDLKGSLWGRQTNVDEEKLKNDATYHPVYKDLNWLDMNERIKFGSERKKIFLDQLKNDVNLLAKLNIMDYSLLLGIHDLEKDRLLDDELIDLDSESLMELSHIDEAETNANQIENHDNNNELVHAGNELTDINNVHNNSHDFSIGNEDKSHDVINKNYFKQFDGGIRNTDEKNIEGNVIYFIGIIDCLTNYSFVKKLETIWRSLSHDPKMFSAIPPRDYADRFYKFIEESVDPLPKRQFHDNPNAEAYHD